MLLGRLWKSAFTSSSRYIAVYNELPLYAAATPCMQCHLTTQSPRRLCWRRPRYISRKRGVRLSGHRSGGAVAAWCLWEAAAALQRRRPPAGGFSGRPRQRRCGIGGCLRRCGTVVSVGRARGGGCGIAGLAFRLIGFENHWNN